MGIAAEFDPGQKVHATEYSNNVSIYHITIQFKTCTFAYHIMLPVCYFVLLAYIHN